MEETRYSKFCKEQVIEKIAAITQEEKIVGTVVAKAFNNVAEGFWHAPASSTGKYHPLYACGDAGLARHTLAAVHFAERFAISQEWNSVQSAYIKGALLLHDTCKLGVKFEERYTLFEHPLLVFLLLDVGTLTPEERNCWEILNSLIRSHMGKWCKPTARDLQYNVERISNNFARVGLSGLVLPVPMTEEAKMVAHCDYLAADKECMLTMFESEKGAWKDIER